MPMRTAPVWLSEANGFLKQIAADQETGPEAAEMLRTLAEQSAAMHDFV